MKQHGWEDVVNEVNAVGGFGRSVAEVKKKWVSMKSQMKGKRAEVKWQQQKTEGGISDAEEIITVDSGILGIIGEVCVAGINEGFDSSMLLLQELSGKHYLICHLYNFLCFIYGIYGCYQMKIQNCHEQASLGPNFKGS